MRPRDPEVLEVLRDEPELLAIADAVAETQSPPRRRRRLAPAVAGASAAAALVVFALVGPWEDSGRNPVIERALAAIGTGPVVHVKETVLIGDRVELATGRSMPVATHWELWFDEERKLARFVVKRDGRVIRDDVRTGAGAGQYGELAGFTLGAAARFRDLLEDGKAEVVGEGEVDGRQVYWLRIEYERPRGGPAITSEIAVDRSTYEPVVSRFLRDGKPIGYETRTLVIETLPRGAVVFRSATGKPSQDSPSLSSGVGETIGPSLSPADARHALSHVVGVWCGPRLHGLELTQIDARNVMVSRDGTRRSGQMLVVSYGASLEPLTSDEPGVTLREMAADSPARSLVADDFAPPPRGFVDVSQSLQASGGAGQRPVERRVWHGVMRHRGLWISIEATSRKLLLAAGRALRPLP